MIVRANFFGNAGCQISQEGLVLFLIALLDAVSSAVLFHFQIAVEANPLLRPAADAGPLPFLLMKCLTFIPPIAILEVLRHRNPRFVTRLLRWAVRLYVVIYGVATLAQFAGLNFDGLPRMGL